MTLENYFANHKPVMPATVARTDKDGLPTKELIDWEQLTLDFFDKTVTSLDERTATVEVATDDLEAVITTVEAHSNGATANGQVYLIAETAPTGYSAQYGWTLTAGNNAIGMKALVDGVGNGYIGFLASQFFLIDPSYLGGDPVTVFNYNGTTFNFDVPVTIRNQEIGANAVSNTVAVTGVATSGTYLDTPTLTVRDPSRVLLEVKLTDTSGSIYLGTPGTSFITRSFPVLVDAGSIGNLNTMDTIADYTVAAGPVYSFWKAFSPASAIFVVTGLTAGGHYFSVQNTSAYPLGFTITATELSK